MIHGYPRRASVVPGDDLLHVSTDASSVCVDYYRYGADYAFVSSCDWQPGSMFPHHLPYKGWGQDDLGLHGEEVAGWPSYRFPVPDDWASGVAVVNAARRQRPHGLQPDR